MDKITHKLSLGGLTIEVFINGVKVKTHYKSQEPFLTDEIKILKELIMEKYQQVNYPTFGDWLRGVLRRLGLKNKIYNI